MKTEINNENKAKFFGQYWGQGVFKHLHTSVETHVNESDLKLPLFKHSGVLELKPLSSISDEDAIEIAKMSRTGSNFTHKKDWKIVERNSHFIVLTWKHDKETNGLDWTYRLILYLQGSLGYEFRNPKYKRGEAQIDMISVIDYLRSKGYALPWMGLSVEEMIEAGWIKLIGS